MNLQCPYTFGSLKSCWSIKQDGNDVIPARLWYMFSTAADLKPRYAQSPTRAAVRESWRFNTAVGGQPFYSTLYVWLFSPVLPISWFLWPPSWWAFSGLLVKRSTRWGLENRLKTNTDTFCLKWGSLIEDTRSTKVHLGEAFGVATNKDF